MSTLFCCETNELTLLQVSKAAGLHTEKKLCMWGVDVWLVFQRHLIKVCDVKIQIDWGGGILFTNKLFI